MIRNLLKTRRSKLKIDNHIFNGLNKNNNIDALLKILQFHRRTDLIFSLSSDKRLPSEYRTVYKKKSSFHYLPKPFYGNNDIYMYWLLGLFQNDSEIIKFFLVKQKDFSLSFLNGDANKCLSILDEVDSVCLSWWSIKNRLGVKTIILKENANDCIDELVKSLPQLNISNVTADFQILTKSSNNIEYYLAHLLSRFNEYKNSGLDEAFHEGNIDSCNLLPITFDLERETDFHFLQCYRHWPLIDNFLIFKSIIIDRYSKKQTVFTDKNLESTALSVLKDAQDFECVNLIQGNELLFDNEIDDVVKNYTIGNYADVITKIDFLIHSNNKKCFDLFEIYTKSKLYSGSNFKGSSFYNTISENYAKVLNLSEDSHQAKIYLYYIAFFFRHDQWAISLITHLSLDNSKINGETNDVLLRQNHILGSLNTPKSRSINFIKNNADLAPLIPNYRGGNKNLQNPDEFIIYSDYLKLKLISFDVNENINEVIEFCLSEYFKNKSAYNFFPTDDIFNKIKDTDDFSKLDKIGCLLFLDMYRNESDKNINELINNIFDILLQEFGEYRPSEIFKNKSLTDKEFIFLKNICVPIILDSIVEFDTNDEVINERVSIIDLLISTKNLPELQVERDRVLESMLSEKLRAKIESGKLYVDVQAIESQKRSIYDQLFKNYQIASSLNYSIDKLDVVAYESDESKNKKILAAAKIFHMLVADFALNEEYGLDKYLSAEVRHQVFKSQIRVNFEKNNLITQKNNDNYIANTYWSKKYTFISPEILILINNRLNIFSRNIDEIIESANNRLRIVVALEQSDYIFDFRPTEKVLSDISHILDNSDIESYFEKLIDYMWSWAERCAKKAQVVINDEMLPLLIDEVDSLYNEILEIKTVLQMQDLMTTITSLRTDIKNSTERIINWFRFVGSKEDISYEKISVVIDAAIASIDSLYAGRGKSMNFSSDQNSILLNYQESKALFISIFTALENSLKYSINGECVQIDFKSFDSFSLLEIKNKLNNAEKNNATIIESIKEKWLNSEKYLNIKEGGSGIYKIRDMLMRSSAGFDVEVSIIDGDFILQIKVVHENFSNRG